MKKLSNFGLLKRIKLKATYKLMKLALNNSMMGLYMALFEYHFKTYFDGKILRGEVIAKTKEGIAAMKLHGRTVVKVIYHNQRPDSKKMIYKASAIAFRDNIILDLKI